jgi:hypothetical protein
VAERSAPSAEFRRPLGRTARNRPEKRLDAQAVRQGGKAAARQVSAEGTHNSERGGMDNDRLHPVVTDGE